MKTFTLLSTALLASSSTTTTAFSTPKPNTFDPLNLATTKTVVDSCKTITPVAKFAAAAAATFVAHPLAALAEEADDYEYGAVNAPIGIAWAAGSLLILTSLLPLALQGGEEAFEEMKETDSQTWGKKNSNVLSGRGKPKKGGKPKYR